MESRIKKSVSIMYVCWECVPMYSGVWGGIGHRARIGTLGFMAFIGLQVYVGRYTIILFQTAQISRI